MPSINAAPNSMATFAHNIEDVAVRYVEFVMPRQPIGDSASHVDSHEAAIEAGAELFPEEAEALVQRIAEADTDTWVGHHGFEIDLADGTLFAHFEGHSLGQGGMQFEYCNTFKSKEALIEYIENQPLSMLEV